MVLSVKNSKCCLHMCRRSRARENAGDVVKLKKRRSRIPVKQDRRREGGREGGREEDREGKMGVKRTLLYRFAFQSKC